MSRKIYRYKWSHFLATKVKDLTASDFCPWEWMKGEIYIYIKYTRVKYTREKIYKYNVYKIYKRKNIGSFIFIVEFYIFRCRKATHSVVKSIQKCVKEGGGVGGNIFQFLPFLSVVEVILKPLYIFPIVLH